MPNAPLVFSFIQSYMFDRISFIPWPALENTVFIDSHKPTKYSTTEFQVCFRNSTEVVHASVMPSHTLVKIVLIASHNSVKKSLTPSHSFVRFSTAFAQTSFIFSQINIPDSLM